MMQCPLCGHPKIHKQGKTSKGSQCYRYPHCHPTFSKTFDTLYYRRQVSLQTIQTHTEGSSLRGLSRITGVTYNTCMGVVRSAGSRVTLDSRVWLHNERN